MQCKRMEALTIEGSFRGARGEGTSPSKRHIVVVYMESGLPDRIG